MQRAEEKLGRPVYMVEIAREFRSMWPNIGCLFIMVTLQDCYKKDEVLADYAHDRWTLNPAHQSTAENPTEFELFSDRVHRLWPTYVLNSRCAVRPGPLTVTTNFAQLKELLLSKDLSRNSELDWVSTKHLRFLDGTDITG